MSLVLVGPHAQGILRFIFDCSETRMTIKDYEPRRIRACKRWEDPR